MQKKEIAIIGSGTMGTGVAQLFAQFGYNVLLVDISQNQLNKAEQVIRHHLHYLSLTMQLSETCAVDTIISRIQFTTNYQDLNKYQFIIENITENWGKKAALYEIIREYCDIASIIGINTSAISISRAASVIGNPGRVIGIHFMNPAPMMPVVEVIKARHTSESTITQVGMILQDIKRKMVIVNDSPGFVTNRAMMLFVNEAIFMLQENVAEVQDIDNLFRQCFGHKMGPLQTADLIGLDTVLYSLETLAEGFADVKYRPCWLLKEMVYAGLLGQKSGQGFYQYEI